jgi:hypothetical protein
MARGLRILVLLALLSPLGVPPAAAQEPGRGERADILDAEFPPTVVADRPFTINVTVANREGSAQTVLLFASLYQGQGPPCEGQRVDHRISRFVKSVTLQPREQVRVEGWKDHWVQVVNRSRLAGDGTFEVCVWLRAATCPTDLPACFLDFHSLQQPIRLRNAPPQVQGVAEPPQGAPGTLFTLRAQGTDADGDALTYRWDFPAGGSEQGPRVQRRFALGEHVVRLNATDGWDSVEVPVRVVVAEGAAQGNALPGFEALLAAAAVGLAARARRRA